MTVVLSTPIPTNGSADRLLGLRGYLWPLADQALISGTNFVITILLARALTVEAFGGYALVYAGLMLFGGLQTALITQPHNVLGAIRHGVAYRRYNTTTALLQLLLATLSTLVVLAGWGGSVLAGWSTASLLLPLAGAVFAWQMQEFIRRVLYTEGRVSAAFVNDLIGYGGQLLLVAAGWYCSAVSASRALHFVTASSLLAALIGCWQLRGSWSRRSEPGVVRENWQYGKWLLGACIMSEWLATQLFLFVAAFAPRPRIRRHPARSKRPSAQLGFSHKSSA